MYIHIYIYIYLGSGQADDGGERPDEGFDSSIILILRGGIPRPIGDFPESLSQAILVGIMLVGKSGVCIICNLRGLGPG